MGRKTKKKEVYSYQPTRHSCLHRTKTKHPFGDRSLYYYQHNSTIDRGTFSGETKNQDGRFRFRFCFCIITTNTWHKKLKMAEKILLREFLATSQLSYKVGNVAHVQRLRQSRKHPAARMNY